MWVKIVSTGHHVDALKTSDREELKMIEKIGLQAYSVREHMKDEESIRESFAKLKAMGYNTIQTAGCAVPHAVYGKLAKEAGLEICGTHENFDTLTGDPELAMENHKALDTKNIGIGGYWELGTEEKVKEFIARANKFADTIAQKGFKFTYHNHMHEFRRVGGKTVMDWLIEGLDPDTTSFVLDTYWVQFGGGDVRHMIERLDGRIDILHLKDMKIKEDNTQSITEVGNGTLWWDAIIPAAEQIGVKYFVVEEDYCDGDEFDCVRQSINYLSRFIKK